MSTDMPQIELLATIWLGFEHFTQFVGDSRLDGIRVNPAAYGPDVLSDELKGVDVPESATPLYFDVKGRQLRIKEILDEDGRFEIVLNHPISLDTDDYSARRILFKGGGDHGIITALADGGQRLVFSSDVRYQPRWSVHEGESLHILHPSLKIHGPLFSDNEITKIQMALGAGFTRFFLSYVECQADIDALREIIGKSHEVWLKIESPEGLRFVQNDFVKEDGLVLTVARGDLFVELTKSELVTDATRMIIERDPEACMASRLLLSTVRQSVPADERERVIKALFDQIQFDSAEGRALRRQLLDIFFEPRMAVSEYSELAWLLDIGYRRFMLCDELCSTASALNIGMDTLRRYERSYRARDFKRRTGQLART